MAQTNQEYLTQYCQELGLMVNETIDGCDELLSVIEEILKQYRPKFQEEAIEFIRLRFTLPDYTGLLCNLRKIDRPDDDALYDSFAPLIDRALEVTTRMVSADVIINDIINMYMEPEDHDVYIYLYLTTLKPISNSLYYVRGKLEELYKETSQKWPDLIVSYFDEEEEYEEDLVLPEEIESFQNMRDILVKAFTMYTNEHKSERISDFFIAIQDYLEAFAKGAEPDMEFDFGFLYNYDPHEIRYIDFHFELGMLQVSSGGSTYSEFVGSDSFTDWTYSIGLNGWDEGNYNCNFMTVLELVRMGAKLTIEGPDEYIDYEEDE